MCQCANSSVNFLSTIAQVSWNNLIDLTLHNKVQATTEFSLISKWTVTCLSTKIWSGFLSRRGQVIWHNHWDHYINHWTCSLVHILLISSKDLWTRLYECNFSGLQIFALSSRSNCEVQAAHCRICSSCLMSISIHANSFDSKLC